MTMQDLIGRRSLAAARHDAARARFAHDDPRLGETLRPIVGELATVAEAMLSSSEAPPDEIGRTYMWLGDAWFDLAQGRHASFARAIQAYRQADPYVRVARDPVLSAKFDANLANILVRSDPNPTVLADAVRRYEAALPVLSAHAPQHVQFVKGELERARNILAQFQTCATELEARSEEAHQLLLKLPSYAIGSADADGITQRLGELAKLRSANSLAELVSAVRTAQDLLVLLMELVSRVGPYSGLQGRPAFVADIAFRLWKTLAAGTLDASVDAATRDRSLHLMSALVEVAGRIAEGPVEAIAAVERTQLREVAAEARRVLAGGHLTWLCPEWLVSPAPTTPNGVHVTDTPHRKLVERLCATRELDILDVGVGEELAEARFDALRRAAVVVADLSSSDRRVVAANSYEIGIALALGKPLVVLGPADGGLPFDVDIEPVPVQPVGIDEHALGCVLDRALLLPQRTSSRGDLLPLVNAARTQFSDQPMLIDELARHSGDPLTAAAVLDSILRADSAQSGRARMVAYPAWRRKYADPQPKRLFHVMPFRAAWSDELKRRGRTVCGTTVTYFRHDDDRDPHIIRSLWNELCLADRILVDLTDLNANVLVELGIAHTLGTPTLIVGQLGTVDLVFPMLKRTRIVEYDPTTDDFERALESFLSA